MGDDITSDDELLDRLGGRDVEHADLPDDGVTRALRAWRDAVDSRPFDDGRGERR